MHAQVLPEDGKLSSRVGRLTLGGVAVDMCIMAIITAWGSPALADVVTAKELAMLCFELGYWWARLTYLLTYLLTCLLTCLLTYLLVPAQVATAMHTFRPSYAHLHTLRGPSCTP